LLPACEASSALALKKRFTAPSTINIQMATEYRVEITHRGVVDSSIQDSLTNSIAVDLYCDLGISSTQSSPHILEFDSEPEQTMAVLYLHSYSRVEVKVC